MKTAHNWYLYQNYSQCSVPLPKKMRRPEKGLQNAHFKSIFMLRNKHIQKIAERYLHWNVTLRTV